MKVAKLTADQKTKLETDLKRQIETLGSDKLAGADPKEVSSLISKLKAVQEKLAGIPLEAPPPPAPAFLGAIAGGSSSARR